MPRRKSSKINPPPQLSIIIPVYNQVDQLPNLHQIHRYLQSQVYTWEIVVIDDGSTDQTYQTLESYESTIPMRLLRQQPHTGPGAALRDGMLAARGLWRLAIDLQTSISLDNIPHAWDHTLTHAVIIGQRHGIDRFYNWLACSLLHIPHTDLGAPFKLFSAEATQQIFSQLSITQSGYEAQLLSCTHQLGYTIYPLPVIQTTHHRPRQLRDFRTLFSTWTQR